ncbi:hypothetical protein AgCh_039383 [Apium graveolens]
MEIFNSDTVEINYPLRPIAKMKRISSTNVKQYDPASSEIQKMAANFSYNATGNSRMSYKLYIKREHLLQSNWTKVFSEDGISKLHLNKEICWINLCLDKQHWIIQLKWVNDRVLYGTEWTKLLSDLDVKEGDICIISRTTATQSFKISLTEAANNIQHYKEVHASGMSNRKCFKMLTHEMLEKGAMELPEKFIECHGSMLSERITIYMGNGSQHEAKFSSEDKVLYSLHDIFQTHSMKESFFFFLDYVGPSGLYATVFNNNCTNILDANEVKARMPDIQTQYLLNNLGNSTDSSETEDYSDDIIEHEPEPEPEDQEDDLSFNITIKPSHLDSKEHGRTFQQSFSIYMSPGSTTQLLHCYMKEAAGT